ncbi:MAG: hypothetical protein ISR77_12095 [Pirellulaceae bacterium]|nr:hypothetical protein [Pirellulaceae bacterium]
MKRTLELAAVPLACVLMLTAVRFVDANEPPTRGEAVAVNLEAGPPVDGTMNDPAWKRCPPWPTGACTSENRQEFETWAKVLFDGTYVYVGVYCAEPDTDGMAIRAAKRDDAVWGDDSVEVFLRPDPQKPYCQFAVNPRGTLYDACDRQREWNSSAEVKTSVVKGRSWTAVLKIPMKEIDAYVGEDQMWTMNIYRSRNARGGDPSMQYSWSIMTGDDYHAAREFGIVTGVNVPRRADGVRRVRATPAPKPIVPNRGKELGGVTVYHKMNFDKDVEGWEAVNGGKISLVGDSVHGQAIHVACDGDWAGANLPVSISGSRGLKMALMMKGRNLETPGVNIYDTIAGDNTTPYGYRYLQDGHWTPILYFLDRCRYNSRTTGFVAPVTGYSSVRFYGPAKRTPGTAFAQDNFVFYRGTDRQPPTAVTDLMAQATRSGVRLSWQPADDNVAVQVYVISRADRSGAFQKIGESHTTQYQDATAAKGKYRYRVFAVDFEENFGPWCDPVPVDSISASREPKVTREQQDRLGYAAHVRRIQAKGKGKVRKGHTTLFGDSLTSATVYPQRAQAAFRNMTVNAYGYPSMRTSFGRDKVHEILQKDNPEFMFVLYGTNNNKAEPHLPQAMDDLAAIVRACEDRGTVAILGTIPPRGWTPESQPEANFNKHVIELCRKLKIPTGYIFEDFQAAGDRRTYMGGDGVHWRGEGMAIGAKAWGKALDQIRFALRDQG